MNLTAELSIKENYPQILSLLRKNFESELQHNENKWAREQVRHLVRSLDDLLNSQITKDVADDLTKAGIPLNSPLIPTIRSCLGLLKSIENEGDPDLGSNRFYLDLMQGVKEESGKDETEANGVDVELSTALIHMIRGVRT